MKIDHDIETAINAYEGNTKAQIAIGIVLLVQAVRDLNETVKSMCTTQRVLGVETRALRIDDGRG